MEQPPIELYTCHEPSFNILFSSEGKARLEQVLHKLEELRTELAQKDIKLEISPSNLRGENPDIYIALNGCETLADMITALQRIQAIVAA